MEYFIDGFRQFGNFSGRANRKQYWMFFLYYFILSIVVNVLDLLMGTFILSTVFGLIVLIPSISLGARRLHDTGHSGWWQLLIFLVVIGWVILAVMLARDSQGDNAYGPAPAAA